MNWTLAQQLTVNGIVTGTFYALIGMSWNAIYATTRIFHFAHALVFVVAAYGAVMLVAAGAPLVLALLVGIAVGALGGALCEVGVYRPLRRHGSTQLSLFLASMGLTVAGANAVQLIFGAGNRSLGSGLPQHVFSIGRASFDALDLIMFVVTWALFAVVVVLETRSRWGRALSAVRTNPELAAAVGIRVDRAYTVAFALGSGLLAIAALYYVAKNAAAPSIGIDPVISGLIAMFLGGIGNTSGVVLGGLVTGLSQNLGGLWLPGEYQGIVSFLLLIVILIVRPQGLLERAPR